MFFAVLGFIAGIIVMLYVTVAFAFIIYNPFGDTNYKWYGWCWIFIVVVVIAWCWYELFTNAPFTITFGASMT